MKIIEIENSFLEELRCEICNDYLICFPIRVCTDGQIICGKCEPEGDQLFEPCQVSLLEKMIKMAKFSCKFKENGCDEELSVDFVTEHESKCIYRRCSCICKDCNWDGLLVDMQSHFSDKHLVYNNKVNITTNWKNNFDDVLLACIEGVPVLVEYKYCKDTAVLNYKISYISAYIQEAAYQIYNDNTNLTAGQFLSYNQSSIHELNIKAILGRVLSIKIRFVKYPQFVVDYATLKLFLCIKCGNYLLPFAYDYQPSGYTCELCAQKHGYNVPSTKSIFKTIPNPSFPCKWKYCNFVSSANIMYKHEKACRFRIYQCPLDKDCVFGNSVSIIRHLNEKHGYHYFNKETSMKQLPEHKPKGTVGKRFTFRDGTFIIFTVTCEKTKVEVEISHFGNCKTIPVYLEFKHDHCVTVSKQFCVLNENECITMDDLPHCFKETQTYTVFATIN